MPDSRIRQLQKWVLAMERGNFNTPAKIEGDDEIGSLGKSLVRLSKSMDEKFQYQVKILEFTKKLNEGLFINDVLNHVSTSFQTVIPYNRIGFALLEKDGEVLRAHWASSDAKNIALKIGYAEPIKGSSLEQIIKRGEPRIINDLEQYLIEKPESQSTRLVLAEGIHSNLTCPLISMGKPIGFLFFSSNEKNIYADIHQDVFCILASQISAVVEKSKLYEELYNVNKFLKESRDAFKRQATHDALTGLWNRGAIMELLDKELARASRKEKGIALLMIDVDHFKRINDNFGHLAGDNVLKEVANRLVSVARCEDSVGRYGGEEFVVVFSDLEVTEMVQVAERYRRIIENKGVNISGDKMNITISLGLGYAKEARHISNEALIALADTALYAAKKAGRNQLQVQMR